MNEPAPLSTSTTTGGTATSAPTSRAAVTAYGINAGLAWLGVALTALISALDGYDRSPVEPGLYGDTAVGAAGALARLTDTFSYFTLWSNVVVALAMTALARAPHRDTPWRRVLRLDAVLMITITAIVYAVLLAPITEVTGWSRLTNPILHILTPAVTIIVWLVFGPRGWITGRTVLMAMLVPLAWIVWMLARGAVIGAYPYGFANVAAYGYGPVLQTLAMILVFGVVLSAVFWGVDRLLSRRISKP